MIRNYIHWLLGTYAFQDIREFLYSLFPSFKYNIQSLTISLSILAGVINSVFGIGPALAVCMLIAVLVETWTGIKASRIRQEKFESFKFSRCVIKVFVWIVLIYIANSFSNDCANRNGWINSMGELFFEFVRIAILTYFCVEYVTSILENYAVIDGKPKDALVNAIREKWSILTDLLKKKNEK